MRWSDVLADKTLRDLPYKIELNEWGKIEMTPASNKHGNDASKIAFQLQSQLPDGETITACSIETDKGVKVADVAWCSQAFLKKHGFATPFTEAPEICVEILSPSHMREAMREKIRLYLNTGATEVWLVYEDGQVEFYNRSGAVAQSQLDISIAL